MCGISGIFHFDKERQVRRDTLKRMNDVLFHRGPDGEGFHVEGNLGLGHRRLAIIDLKTGNQPMFSEDRQISLVFNGEIYNYLELKEELTALGNTFATSSDTEVIIAAYRTWGIDCQQRFNGMWAFAIWDQPKQRLFVSRDRIGEKPLYYSTFDNSFIFGSEIKAVLAYGVPQTPRMELTELYLTLGFIPAPYTYFKDVQQLLPGKCLLIDANGVKEKTYWSLPDISEKDLLTGKEYVEKEFALLFNNSVEIRMRSDVGFGAFLSGGLDSSCIVSVMANHTKKKVQTFTMGFENAQFDERKLAERVAVKFDTEHHVGTLTSEQFDAALEKVLEHYDDPFGDASAIPTGQISRYAAEFVKMVLTGDGGDEVLSGYTIYQGEKFARQYHRLPSSLQKALPALAKTGARPFKGNIRYKLNRVARVLESSSEPFEKRLYHKLCHVPPGVMGRLYKPTAGSVSFFDFYREAMKGCRFTDPFYKLMYFHHAVTLPGDMLTKVDRMSMAYSIETRIPFLDHRIIELLFGVHKDLKMKGYINKVILRNTIANPSLPKQLLTAPKKGFTVPLRDWFKEEEIGKKIRNVLLTDDDSLFDTIEMEKLIRETENANADSGNFIWMMLVLKKWLDAKTRFLKEPALAMA